jgi:hypothetical protein
MNYNKLDPGLQVALESADASVGRVLDVFVQTDGSQGPEAIAVLERMGVRNVRPHKKVFTAQLAANVLDELSEQPWVRALTLSTPLRPLT